MDTYPRIIGITTPKQAVATKCDRCGGSGFYHIFGTCFRCGGNGVDPTYRDWGFPSAWTDEQCAEWDAARIARNDARRARANAKRQAEHDAAHQAALAQYPILATLDEVRMQSTYVERTTDLDDHVIGQRHESGAHWSEMASFMLDIYWQGCRTGRLSERQVAALERGWEHELTRLARLQQRAADAVDAAPVPTGRVEIEGEVVMTRWYEGDYGSTQKMLVVGDAGWKVFVTVPSKLSVGKGDRVRFTADVTAADDDPTFGKGKRPTKASVVQEATP